MPTPTPTNLSSFKFQAPDLEVPVLLRIFFYTSSDSFVVGESKVGLGSR
jgi:hypothetical protein